VGDFGGIGQFRVRFRVAFKKHTNCWQMWTGIFGVQCGIGSKLLQTIVCSQDRNCLLESGERKIQAPTDHC
jgi:hypothetical protein